MDLIERLDKFILDTSPYHVLLNEKGYKCRECGKKMNPAERMLGPVCGECVRKKHKEAIGKK